MDDLITKVQKQWKAAKDTAQSLCEDAGRHDMACKLGACEMFKGTENLEELVRLMFTPRGIEFMTTYSFPDLKTFRKFKKYHPERLGVYIDAGKIELSESRKVFLVGDTKAVLHYSETAGNRVFLMHGAKATVDASEYAVVRIEKDKASTVRINADDKAYVR